MRAVIQLQNLIGYARKSVTAAQGWQAALLALIAGGLSALAFAPFFLSPMLLVTLPVLIWLTDDAATRESDGDRPRFAFDRVLVRRGAWCGWWYGFGIHIAGLYWIGNSFLVQADAFAWLLPFATVILPAGLAVFHAAAIAVFAGVQGPPIFRVIALALALGASEWLRGNIFTGFPWNVLGYALTQPIELMQFAGVVGIYGLTIITVLVFAAPLAVLGGAARPSEDKRLKSDIVSILVSSIVPVLLMWISGTWMLNQPLPADDNGTRLLVVQPSIAQRDKFDRNKWNSIFEAHIALTAKGLAKQASGASATNIVFWPEAAMPFLALRSPNVSARIADVLPENTYLVAGLLRAEQSQNSANALLRVFNSAVVFDAGGKAISIYDKFHLVPFGEYLPFQETLEAVGLEQLTRQRGGFTSGTASARQRELPGLGQAVFLICYEVIFPDYSFEVGKRPKLLLNLTNDAWFGESTGPYQHFHQSRVRAVEQGLPLLRAANNGISGIVDAQGRLRSVSPINAVEVISSSLPGPGPATIYSLFGDRVAAAMFIILLLSTIIIGCRFRVLTD